MKLRDRDACIFQDSSAPVQDRCYRPCRSFVRRLVSSCRHAGGFTHLESPAREVANGGRPLSSGRPRGGRKVSGRQRSSAVMYGVRFLPSCQCQHSPVVCSASPHSAVRACVATARLLHPLALAKQDCLDAGPWRRKRRRPRCSWRPQRGRHQPSPAQHWEASPHLRQVGTSAVTIKLFGNCRTELINARGCEASMVFNCGMRGPSAMHAWPCGAKTRLVWHTWLL